MAWLPMGGEGGERKAGAGGTFGWGRRNQAGEGSEGGEITSAEYLQANERTEKAAKKPREMRGSQNSFYFAVWLLQGRDRRKRGGGGE